MPHNGLEMISNEQYWIWDYKFSSNFFKDSLSILAMDCGGNSLIDSLLTFIHKKLF